MDAFSPLAGHGEDAGPASHSIECSRSPATEEPRADSCPGAAKPARMLRPGEKAPRPVARDPLHDIAMEIADRAFETYAATFRELAK